MQSYKKWVTKSCSLFVFIFVFAQLSACGDDGSSTLTAEPSKNKGGVAIPKVLKTALPDTGTLSAYIRVDDGARQQMAVADDFASISLNGLTQGEHTITVEFEFVFQSNPNQPIMLARASKIIDVGPGENSLNIEESDYDTSSFDMDGDQQPNLTELINNTNPFAGILIAPVSLNTAEDGGAAKFTVVLTYEPSADVSLEVSSSDPTEGNVDKNKLIFNISNWNTPQTVTVTGADDDIADGDVQYAIVMASATSLDSNYNGLTPDEVSVINADNDFAEFNVSAISGNTTETGISATFSVALSSQPDADVTIGLSSTSLGEGIIDKTLLTFTSTDWNVDQEVTVTGVDDAVADGNQSFQIVLAAASSTDPQFDGQNPPDVSVVNIDNDSPGFNISPISGNTSEGGGTATFTAQLNTQPTAPVTITVSSSDTTEGTPGQTTISFDSANWNNPQTVSITGVDDDVSDGNQNYSVILAEAVSDDSSYNGQNPDDVNIVNTDDEPAPTITLKVDAATIAEADGVATITATTDVASTQNIVINLGYSGTAAANTDYTPAGVVTITAGNTTGTATLTAIQDSLDEDDETIVVDLTSIVNAPKPITQSLSISISDDDQPPTVTLNINTTSPLAEAGGSADLTATLSEPSGRAVIVNLAYSGTATAGTDYSKTDSIIISAGNTLAQATVTAINDSLVEIDETIIVEIAGVINGIEVEAQQINASIVDEEIGVGVTVSGFSTGNAMVLRNNGADDLVINADGFYIFESPALVGALYNVTIATPSSELKTNCTVINGNGANIGADVTNIQISCSDTIAPKVVVFTPAMGSIDAEPTTAIEVTFDEAMSAGSITTDALTVVDSFDQSNITVGAVTYDPDNRSASFTLNSPLALLRTYTVTLSSNITDFSGQRLISSGWSFTTRDGDWRGAQLIDVNNNKISSPHIALNSKGDGLAVWTHSDGTNSNIWASRIEVAKGTWGIVKLIETNNLGSASNPQVAIDPAGHGLAVWKQSDGTLNNIWANRFDADTGDWEVAQLIESNDLVSSSDPTVALDSVGNGIAVWRVGANIWANHFNAGSNEWGKAQLIESNTKEIAMAMAPMGDALVLFVRVEGAWDSIFAKHFDADTNTWGTAELVEKEDLGPAEFPQIAMDSLGNGMAVWDQNDDDWTFNYNIMSNRFDATTGMWESAQYVDTDVKAIHRFPQIALDSKGNAIAVWYAMTNAQYIHANSYDAISGSWGTQQLIDTGVLGITDLPKIALDAQGHGLAVWSFYDETATRDDIWAARFNANSNTWGAAQRIENENVGNSGSSPSIFVNPAGYGIAVLNQSDGTSWNTMWNRFE